MRVDSISDLPREIQERVAKELLEDKRKHNKYHNVRAEVNGIKFDSKKEAKRYGELLQALRAGLIDDLRLQPEFTLQEGFTTADGRRVRAIRYRADFSYTCLAPIVPGSYPGERIVEDVKSQGTMTKAYQIKKKLLQDRMGIEIREVR